MCRQEALPFLVETLFLLQLIATIGMTGLIWFVQIVHYPLFELVEHDHPRYALQHQRRTGWVVGLPMLVELGTALAFLAPSFRPAFVQAREAVLGAVLVGVIWAATAALQIPAHTRLGRAFDAVVIRGLVRGNWIRTAGWSARTLLICLWLTRLEAPR